MKSPEEAYAEQIDTGHRRRLGQYFTPKQAADMMARWIAEHDEAVTILDPAVGLGIFFSVVDGAMSWPEIYIYRIRCMMAYLLTDVSKELMEDNRRDYGGGLRKFEPHDIQNARVADVEQLPAAVREEVLNCYHAYRSSEEPEHLARLNALFLEFMNEG